MEDIWLSLIHSVLIQFIAVEISSFISIQNLITVILKCSKDEQDCDE